MRRFLLMAAFFVVIPTTSPAEEIKLFDPLATRWALRNTVMDVPVVQSVQNVYEGVLSSADDSAGDPTGPLLRGHRCLIMPPGRVKVIAYDGDEVLLRYFVSDRDYSYGCPSGVIFFLSLAEWKQWPTKRQAIIQELELKEKAEQAKELASIRLVRRLLALEPPD